MASKPENASSRCRINAVVSEYLIPPIKDMLVLGRNAPIGCIAMRRALELLVHAPYEHMELESDEVIGDILVRKSLLRRVPRECLMDYVLREIKPLLGPEEVLHVELNISIMIHDTRADF